jgi:NAD-dependent dihydropyrimidine dehydrogenase PreA subunit
MRIDPEKCSSCLECIDYCPVGCIHEGADGMTIDQDECVECGVCQKVEVCPTEAFFMPPESLVYPRAIRMQFSDPAAEHPVLKAWGRGTEEAKTNDVTGKFSRDEYGLLFEFGRPGTGTRFTEIEKITVAVRAMGLEILEDNPIFALIEDMATGRFKKDFVNEKILSGILEIKIRKDQLGEVVDRLFPLLSTLETVVSVGLVTRFEDDGGLPVMAALEKMGVSVRPNAKINVGLGRPLVA